MEFAAEMIGQATVIIVNTEVGRAYLADPQFLLLIGRCRHRIAILHFRRNFLLANILNFLHEFHALFHFTFSSCLLCLSQFLTDRFGQLVNFLRFRTNFS